MRERIVRAEKDARFDLNPVTDPTQNARNVVSQLEQAQHDFRADLLGARGFDREFGIRGLDRLLVPALADQQQIRIL